jgi:hypothetical protein
LPTVSEPQWPETHERIEQVIKDFIAAKPLSVDDSEHVLSARLFGLGLRGSDLRSEVNRTVTEKLALERKQINRHVVHHDIARLSDKNYYVGQHDDFIIERRATGYYWVLTRDNSGLLGGPFNTSKEAYAAFHNHMGWEML